MAAKQAGSAPQGRERRLFLIGACFAGLVLSSGSGRAATPEADAASPWSSGGHAAARLVAEGAPAGTKERLAALAFRLDPGFITYWRNPGEAGLPPTLDTSASTNVAAVAVDFPTPKRLDEAGATAFGYTGAAALPLRVTLVDGTRPATLVVDVNYAVCSTICLPAMAHLALGLPAKPTPEAAAYLAAAVAAVPRVQPLGAAGPLGIDGVNRATSGGKTVLTVSARAGMGARLFVEPPDGWYLDAGEPVAAGPGRVTVPVTVLQRPDAATLDGLPLRLTLADADGAIETMVHMDETGAKP
jgi:DsbC/DsbD-like thiol-disulfide interchange protein